MDFKAVVQRRADAQAEKAPFGALYDRAFRYTTPHRRGSGVSGGRLDPSCEIYDITAPTSAARAAGQLHQDMWPPDRPWFRIEPGPLLKLAFERRGEKRDLMEVRRHYDNLAEEVRVHVQTGEFDGAAAELASDLLAGTGCMMPLKAGPRDQSKFVRYATLPFDEYALGAGAFGDVGGLHWASLQPRGALMAHWPEGNFPDAFRQAASEKPAERAVVYQDFVQKADGTWRHVYSVEGCDERPVFEESSRTRPFIAPRFYKLAGEMYGRGPLILSLGAIMTLNRVVEIGLRAQALQTLGVWGYRSGSGVNPGAFPLAPGAFWPMQSTGGVMGPDVFRLDTGGREVQAAKFAGEELREQIRKALGDDSLPDGGATPKSATEIMHRVAQIKARNLGAWGRLLHETTPVLIPRVVEILRESRALMTQVDFDELLTRVVVTSPMANAMRVAALQSIMEYVQIVGMTRGPQGIERQLHIEKLLDQVGIDMGVGAEFIQTEAERKAFDQRAAAQAAQAMMAQSVANDPKGAAEAAQIAADPAAAGRPTLSLVA